MKIVKNLSKANIRKYEGFERREDFDFEDDGNYFRGFSYKGMPITTLRSDDVTYLCVRVDYLENEFTYKEWMQTEEFKLCDAFNGVSEFDIDELIENIEAIMAKVAEMNEVAMNDEIDTTEAEVALVNEIANAEQVVEEFKANFKWYDASTYQLRTLMACMKNQVQEIEKAKAINIAEMSKKEKREIVERFNNYGYVRIANDGYYLREMRNAIA